MSPAAFADNPQQERDIAQPDSNFHIYLCFGQSNMEGAAAIEDIDKIGVDERFQVMSVCDVDQGINRTPGEWYTAIPPLCRAGTGLCPADYFGRTMVEHLPDSCRVGVIVVAMGGSGIDAFGKESYADYYATTDDWQRSLMDLYDGNPYKKMVTMAKKAQKEGVIKGVLLHQGESNNTQGDWPQKVQNIYNDLITDLGLDGDKVPLFAGEMLRQEEGGVCWGHNDIIARLPDMMNAYVVSSEGCKGASDGLHFTPEGYRELGRHYAMTVLKNVYHMLPGMPDRPAESLTVGDTDMEIQIGTGIELNLTANFGDGFTEKTPRHVLMFDHALDVLAAEELSYGKARIISRTVEFVPLLVPYVVDGKKRKGFYFDFGRVYWNKPEGYTYKRDRTWQFNNLKPRTYK